MQPSLFLSTVMTMSLHTMTTLWPVLQELDTPH